MSNTQVQSLPNSNIMSLNDFIKSTNSNSPKPNAAKEQTASDNKDVFIPQNGQVPQNYISLINNNPNHKNHKIKETLQPFLKAAVSLAAFFLVYYSAGRLFNAGQKNAINRGKDITNIGMQHVSEVWQDVSNAQSLDELALPDVLKNAARDIIYKIENAKEYINKGGTQKNSLLLYGPPGTGKTTFAKAISKTFPDSRFASIDLSRMQGSYVGQTEYNLNSIVDGICKYADENPTQKIFAFIDEIDSFAVEGVSSNERYDAGVLNTLKKCLSEKLAPRDNIVVIAATNMDINAKTGNLSKPVIDRFDQRIKVDNPTQSQISKAIALHYKNKAQVADYLKDETSKEVTQIAKELSAQSASFRTLETVYNIAASINKKSKTLSFDDIMNAIKQMTQEEGTTVRRQRIGFNA